MGRLGLGLALAVLSAGSAAAENSSCSGYLASTAVRLARTCAWRGPTACRVADAGVVPGGEAYGLRYQLMTFSEALGGAAVVYRRDPHQHLKPLLCQKMEVAAYGHEDRPWVVVSAYGPLLVLPALEEGTGGPQGAVLFQWRAGAWRRVNLERWQEVLRRRIGPKYNGWRGVAYDFRRMTGGSFLYAPGDAHAGPSGYAQMRFTIADGALNLQRLRTGPSAPVFDRMYGTPAQPPRM